ncbi:MAG: PEGA domain-containing protein [Bacteroidales bacterium]|nr:PEGA domain-containing protein [Bacteroidales bacterium]
MCKGIRQIGVLLGLWMFSMTVSADGWITVHTSVRGAEVIIDKADLLVCKGYQVAVPVPAGKHVVMVGKDGYKPYTDTVTVTENGNHLMYIWMEPITEPYIGRTTNFKRTCWDYQVQHGRLGVRWFGVGAGLGTGATLNISLFNMRFGLFELDPVIWGFNSPFYSDVSHVKSYWLVHPHDHRWDDPNVYDVAIPLQGIQFYYTPMVGVHLPIFSNLAFVLSAGPQISWTKIEWSEQLRELPISTGYAFTKDDFPASGFHFDPMWFAIQLSAYFYGNTSDLVGFLRYQDGVFVGIEMRF